MKRCLTTNSTQWRKRLKEYAWLTIATLLMVVGIYFFKFPNHFSTGGVSGLAVILGHYFEGVVTPGTFVLVINSLLLLLGFAVFGKGFGGKTAYVSLLMSGATWVLERVIPMPVPMTALADPVAAQPFVELIFAVSLPAVGSAILFNLEASSGGTDIVAMVLRKYTSLDIGKALLCSDLIITLMAFVAFGPATGLYSILGLVVKSLLVDMVLENINTHKYFHIITTKPQEIERYITQTLKRGATELHGEGVYTHEDRTVVMTVMTRREAVLLRRHVRSVDPQAFVLIMNTGEIVGKGFRGVN
ncbi:MAG: YitT family protein [Clostridia bacterium]|nr:YitT family protein [Clostridia bacterium]